MSWFSEFQVRFRAMFCKRKLEDEMAEEMRHHLELRTERNRAAGMPADEASYAAQRSFGRIEQIKELSRDERGFVWLEQVLQDFRHAAHGLRKSPAFTVVAALSLALGIGANTAVFSLVNAVLLRQLPVKNPQELVLFRWAAEEYAGPAGLSGSTSKDPVTGLLTSTSFSLDTFQQFRKRTDLLVDVFAFAPVRGEAIMIDRAIEQSPLAQVVSGNYYAALGVKPVGGRLLTDDDDRPAAAPVAVISYHYWQNRFGGDLACLGRSIRMHDTAFTIVGITPKGFNGTMQVGDMVDLTFPLAFNNQIHGENRNLADSGIWWLRIIARLKSDVTPEQTRAGLEGLFHDTARDGLVAPRSIAGRLTEKPLPKLYVESGAQGLSDARRRYAESLRLVFGLVAGILVVACANIANLLLARAAVRRREFAIRFALGANRGRIVRQLLIEGLLLAILGEVVGLAFAVWGRDALLALQVFGPTQLEVNAALDGRVLCFTTIVALTMGVACVLVPALRATRIDLVAEFQGGARTLGTAEGSRLARSLIVLQVALSVVLLVGAGLLVRTLQNLRGADLGFERHNVLLLSVGAKTAGHETAPAVEVYERIAGQLRLQPGVQQVALAVQVPLEDSSWQAVITAVGFRPRSEGDDIVKLNRVGPEFFETFQMPLLRGRSFTAQENSSTASPVAVVNETFAREIFGDVNIVGRAVKWYGSKDRDVEIVGVVRDAHYNSVRTLPPRTMFVPFAQVSAANAVTVAVRTATNAPPIRAWTQLVNDIDPRLMISDVRTQEAQIDRLFTQERMLVQLSNFFAFLALGLAAIGLYGLMSYAVSRRTSEIGLRMALGAMPADVMREVLGDSMRLVAIGVGVGVVGGLVAMRVVKHLLFGLSVTDPATYASVAVLLIVVALFAAFMPARRAAKIDPMIALRAE